MDENNSDDNSYSVISLAFNEKIIVTSVALAMLTVIIFGFFMNAMYLFIISAIIFCVSFLLYVFIIAYKNRVIINKENDLQDVLPTQSRSNNKLYDYSLYFNELNVLILFNENSNDVYLVYENGDYEDIQLEIKNINFQNLTTELKQHIYNV